VRNRVETARRQTLWILAGRAVTVPGIVPVRCPLPEIPCRVQHTIGADCAGTNLPLPHRRGGFCCDDAELLSTAFVKRTHHELELQIVAAGGIGPATCAWGALPRSEPHRHRAGRSVCGAGPNTDHMMRSKSSVDKHRSQPTEEHGPKKALDRGRVQSDGT